MQEAKTKTKSFNRDKINKILRIKYRTGLYFISHRTKKEK